MKLKTKDTVIGLLKKYKKPIICLGVVGAMLLGGLVVFYRSQNPTALQMKKSLKYYLTYGNPLAVSGEKSNLGEVTEEVLYVNNQISSEIDVWGDNKRIYYTDDTARLVNYTDGYQMDFGADATFDFACSPIYTDVYTDLYHARVSYEYAPCQSKEDVMGQKLNDFLPGAPFDNGVDNYIQYYFHRFLKSEQFQAENGVTVGPTIRLEKNGGDVEIVHATIENLPSDLCDGYSYVIFADDSRDFHRVLYKYHTEDRTAVEADIMNMVEHYERIATYGASTYDLELTPVLPDNWSEETMELYQRIANQDTVDFGIYTSYIYEKGIEETIPAIEEAVDYTFPVVLSYLHFGTDFPTEFMQENYDKGRIVELTYQITESNNEKLFEYTPQMDIYRGLKDEEIRAFARQVADFGHPFLFRLNNEMNSDWTSYSGVVNMSDPELYVAVYQRFYDIFQEEGVDNCIWIYNPNDRNCPPNRWNNFMAYFPGEEYAQLLGVTGYNNGTYYAETGESWREFDEIYNEVQWCYEPFFSEYPWIITEFACSGIGGDKAQWITHMFDCIGDYENIKIAVWFSSADYDPSKKGVISRPYFLDESPEILAAFHDGIHEMLGE